MNDASAATAGFEALWSQVYDPLVRLAWLLMGDKATAEDVVSTAFLQAYPHLAGLADPVPYLRRAVINTANSYWRHHQAGARATARLVLEPQIDRTVVKFVDVLAQLPPKQRAVVVLRHLYDYSDTEIAGLLGCRAATVRSQARHALATLREVLS